MKWTPPQGTKITLPRIPITDPRFVPTRGADVQAVWRLFGWTPPSEGRPAPPPERPAFEPPLKALRVVNR